MKRIPQRWTAPKPPAETRRSRWPQRCAGLVCAALPTTLLAQVSASSAAAAVSMVASLPDAPQASAQAPFGSSQLRGAMSGTVLDANGAILAGAAVTLENLVSAEKRSALSDNTGYFRFAAVPPGEFKLTITAAGFASWTETAIPMQIAADLDLPGIHLKVASATTDVLVIFSQHDLATEQVRIEEKQRVFGVFPNFYASYVWNAVPLTPRQKFQLAWRSAIDPEAFAASAGIAAVQQADDAFKGYGQGVEGYAKRFGASYADGFIGTMIGGAILPSLLHQDPRYFYKGVGTIRQRALYAMATAVIAKGDNGHWQPNYSNVLGNLAAGGISNLYYPKGNRTGVSTTFENAAIGTGASAVGALIQEFLLRKITPGSAAHDKP